jgi:glyoxylase-like metal-dependent hydrolase (beta-lactamase superfamily II)
MHRMTFERIDIGYLELFALLDGDVESDEPIVDAFPGAPADQLLAYRARYPGVYAPGDGWHLRIRAWLVRHPRGVMLVDTGVGQRGAPGPEWMGAPGDLPSALREAGATPESIDTVVITHVHDDHIGGTVGFEGGTPVPAFPNARYLVQRADLEWQRAAAHESEEDEAIWRILLAPLEAAGVIDAVDGDTDLVEGIQLHLMPGHTPGHQVVRLRSDPDRAIIGSDIFNHPAQVSHPDWFSATDTDHALAAASRRAMLAELASHPGTLYAPTHLTEAFGDVKNGPDGLTGWVPRAGA